LQTGSALVFLKNGDKGKLYTTLSNDLAAENVVNGKLQWLAKDNSQLQEQSLIDVEQDIVKALGK